ncbi:hypothetical protein JYU34_018942 [Plutella xylostella]|uniref:Uncharacterized protein n=1 Tax=Plutella xylostella TaxID=51655 RepID=A0ABQ7PYY1_PLUXY|nr:hypothetical protein JYU34_018942 [Plutella xylostella]
MNICEKSVNMLIDNGSHVNLIVDDVYIVKSEDEMKTMRDEPVDMKANLKDIPEAQWPTRISSMEQISVEEEAEWWREGIIQESYLEYSNPLVSVTRRNTREMIKFINQVIPSRRKIRREAIHEIKKMKRKKEKKVIRKKTRRKKRKEVILGERKIKVMMNE